LGGEEEIDLGMDDRGGGRVKSRSRTDEKVHRGPTQASQNCIDDLVRVQGACTSVRLLTSFAVSLALYR